MDRDLEASGKRHSLGWFGILCVTIAFIIPNYTIAWDAASTAYGLAASGGTILCALLLGKSPFADKLLPVAGTALAVAAALYLSLHTASVPAFCLYRAGLGVLAAASVWSCRQDLQDADAWPYWKFALCVSATYGLLAFLFAFGGPRSYWVILSIAASLLACLVLLLGKGSPSHPAQKPKLSDLLGQQRLKIPARADAVLIFVALCLAYLFFSGLDVILYKDLVKVILPLSPRWMSIFTALTMALGYLCAGFLLRHHKLLALFVACCLSTQCFLLVSILPDNRQMAAFVLPLYILGTSGLDFIVLALPFAVKGYVVTPLRCVSGFLLFLGSKLHIIPSLIPEGWLLGPSYRQVIGMAMLMLMATLTLALGYLQLMRSEWKRQGKDSALSAPASLALPEVLTLREQEVAMLLIRGKDRTEIAETLGIALSTVNKHCNAIYRKTECFSQPELMAKYRHL